MLKSDVEDPTCHRGGGHAGYLCHGDQILAARRARSMDVLYEAFSIRSARRRVYLSTSPGRFRESASAIQVRTFRTARSALTKCTMHFKMADAMARVLDASLALKTNLRPKLFSKTNVAGNGSARLLCLRFSGIWTSPVKEIG